MAIIFTAASAVAQTAQRVINFWVHGQYGSDNTSTGAPWWNPRCWTGGDNGCTSAVECKPNDIVLTTGQVLLHAPWPFKTINQPGGALSYLPTSLPRSPLVGSVQWVYAVIHVLPGLYARANAYTKTPGTHSPDNGLEPNGEKFPIHLPPGVSIQGTSALNTVFDVSSPLDNVAGPAFEFGTSGATGEHSFIDSIAIFGADTEYEGNQPAAKTYAAIAISPDIASAPTISNCFLYGNGIGVLVDTYALNDVPYPVHDGTKLFNNTIAFNHVGLWNGQSTQSTGGKGMSKLILVNNIFDSSPEAATGVNYPTNWAYYPPTVPGVNNACFEGIDWADLQVAGTTAVDSNAYEQGRFNNLLLAGHPAVNLPNTAPRATAPPATPAHDISSYTRGAGVRRGILYVRDALTKSVFATDTGNSQYFDQSPHDFRLSPAVAPASIDEKAPNALNPLVNAGWGGAFPMTMVNGLTVSKPPGHLPLSEGSQNTWAFHNWNWDCEGYGNRRVQKHGTFYGNSGGFDIDIGADELGQLLPSGYRFATTSFMDLNPTWLTSVKVMDNKYLWFLGPPTGPTGLVADPGNVEMPYFRAVDHLLSPPTNYAPGSYRAPWFSTWSFSNATNYYAPTFADTTPHLLDDVHPWWGLVGFPSSNPIWQQCWSNYNSLLYANPTVGRINPTGSYKGEQPTNINYQWLDLSWPSAQQAGTLIQYFNVAVTFRNIPGKSWLRRYDPWGRGYDTNPSPSVFVDTLKPTFANKATPVALRYSMENKTKPAFTTALYDTNLQSFMVLVEDLPDPPGK